MNVHNRSFLPLLALVGIVIISAFFMFQSAKEEPATMDELAHIPSGYGYAKFLDFRLNPEHPPLVKALSAIPLLFQEIKFPTDHKSWTEDVNGQWDAGKAFLYESGNDADRIIFYSRIVPILLTLILIILIYVWASELMGRMWALIPTLLFGFSPTIIAHGHYVTTDVGAALGTFFASYAFVKFLLSPKWGNAIFSGIALGIAELMKFSNILLLPYFVFIGIVFIMFEKIRTKHAPEGCETSTHKINSLSYILSFIAICVIALLVIYGVYALFTSGYPHERQISDTKTILEQFSPQWMAQIPIFLSESKILRPLGEYLLGLYMVIQRASWGNTGYFMGEVSNLGWRHYFPTVFVLKETIPTLLIILAGSLFSLARILKKTKEKKTLLSRFSNYLGTNFPEFSMLSFVVLYWAYSMKSPLNIGMRHLIPTLPFIYILATSGIKSFFSARIFEKKQNSITDPYGMKNFSVSAYSYDKKNGVTWWKKAGISILVVWFVVETFSASPFFLSYFNQIGGGTNGGFKYVADSNYDWGQDLKRLKDWVDARNKDGNTENDVLKIAVDYFGGGNPKYYLGDAFVEWRSKDGNPSLEDIRYLAVSVNILAQASGKKLGTFEQKDEDRYMWLHEIKPPREESFPLPFPDEKAGTSIFIYHL